MTTLNGANRKLDKLTTAYSVDHDSIQSRIFNGFEDVKLWLIAGGPQPKPQRVAKMIRLPLENGHFVFDTGYAAELYAVIITAIFYRHGQPFDFQTEVQLSPAPEPLLKEDVASAVWEHNANLCYTAAEQQTDMEIKFRGQVGTLIGLMVTPADGWPEK